MALSLALAIPENTFVYLSSITIPESMSSVSTIISANPSPASLLDLIIQLPLPIKLPVFLQVQAVYNENLLAS